MMDIIGIPDNYFLM